MLRAYRARIAAAAIVTAFIAIPAALAFRGGAPSMYSGGPTSFGAGCADCHTFNEGSGGVEILGAPLRYRPGRIYEIGVSVFDSEQAGAGFSLSVEQPPFSHMGTLIISDAARTRFASDDPAFMTHRGDGVVESIAEWSDGGGSYVYNLQWQAPASDEGAATFFASGNAINNNLITSGDRYYFSYALSQFATPGDADADTDLDLADFAVFANCFDADVQDADEVCQYLDLDNDDWISSDDAELWIAAMTGPTAPFPGTYVLADAVRGGKLYDRWWTTAGLPAPEGEHPLYPEFGAQSGSTTFRCKECHGWDYKGVDGAYGSGSRYTGIAGLFGSALSAKEILQLLLADPLDQPNGHNMAAYGMTDADLWDMVKFVRESMVDTDEYIGESGEFLGNPDFGGFLFGANCATCHGEDGRAINFGTLADPDYLGTVANENPWEFLHKIRFGHPGSPMPASELLGWSPAALANVAAYCQLLPTE